jgi:hypothetical protein
MNKARFVIEIELQTAQSELTVAKQRVATLNRRIDKLKEAYGEILQAQSDCLLVGADAGEDSQGALFARGTEEVSPHGNMVAAHKAR